MKNNLHVLLGASVADAAARPLHWVYDQKKLAEIIKNKKEFVFFKKNHCPFYKVKLGLTSGYNDVAQLMYKTIKESPEHIEIRFRKNIVKHFGPGSKYWKNLHIRKKYKKVKGRVFINGPWIHQNIIETIDNIKKRKKVTGGKKVNESDGFCAALPYFLYFRDFKKTAHIVSLVANTKKSINYAMAKFYLINFALLGYKDPINEFLRLKIKSYKSIQSDIKKIKKMKSLNHTKITKKLGMACSYPGTFNSSIHCIISSSNYQSAISKTIRAGGCNCSRSNFIGAYFSALKGEGDIPFNWVTRSSFSKSLLIDR